MKSKVDSTLLMDRRFHRTPLTTTTLMMLMTRVVARGDLEVIYDTVGRTQEQTDKRLVWRTDELADRQEDRKRNRREKQQLRGLVERWAK